MMFGADDDAGAEKPMPVRIPWMIRLAASEIRAVPEDASITTIAVARPTRPSVFKPIGLP